MRQRDQSKEERMPLRNPFIKEVEYREFGEDRTRRVLSVPAIASAAVLGAVALSLVASCFAVVDTGRVAVVTRFGTVVGAEGQGFHVKLPIDGYNVIDVTQQQVTGTYSTASRDNQSITQEITAQVVVDPESAQDLYARFLGNHMEGIVAPVLSDGFKAANARFTLEETIEKRDELSAAMLEAVQSRLEPYGIQVVSVEINNVALPEEYKAAVERQKVAERDQVTAKVEQDTALIQAETNRVLAESLDERNFQKMAIEKWDGVLPQYVGGDGSLGLMVPSK